MYIIMESLLLLAYYATEERVYEFFLLSRRIHDIRKRRLREFAETYYPKSAYVGEPGNYWNSVMRYQRHQYILMLALGMLIVAIYMVAAIVEGPTMV